MTQIEENIEEMERRTQWVMDRLLSDTTFRRFVAEWFLLQMLKDVMTGDHEIIKEMGLYNTEH